MQSFPSALFPASALRRALCLVLVLAALLLGACKAEIYQGLSETQANTMLSVLLRHGISAEKIAAKSDFSRGRKTDRSGAGNPAREQSPA